MKKYLFVSLLAFSIMLVLFSFSVADTGIPRGKSAPGVLPDELKSMKIEDYFVESKGLPAGSIQSATGHVVVVHKDTNRAYFAATGDAVYQQDVFYTLKDSRCRIKFSTEDIITMGESSNIAVEEIVDNRISKEKKSSVNMLKGKVMFYVVRLFKYKKVSASVKTPTAVMGVRGTKFGVDVRKVSEKVADLSDTGFIYLAQNEPGSFETVVYGFEGTVDVTSTGDGSTQTVGAGETLVIDNLGAGNVEPTDPDTANQFVGETEGGGGTGGSGSSGEEGTGEGGGETGDTGALDDNSVEDIAQNLTGLTINEQSLPTETDVWPVNGFGYFTAMLTRYNSEVGYDNNGVFVSNSLQDLKGTDLNAEDIINGYTMYVDELAGDNGKLAAVDYGDGGIFPEVPYPVSRTVLAHNEYMVWGYWTQNATMPDDYGDDNWVNNRGYYIAGDNTSDIDMGNLQLLEGSWLYSGGAHGTYWTSDGGVNMTGVFDANVNFMDNQIDLFNLAVAGGGHNASVAGASGSFEGTSHFELSGGSAFIDGIPESVPNADFNASGSFYGPAAQSIGGVWSIMEIEGSNAATGIFHGDKQGAVLPPSESIN